MDVRMRRCLLLAGVNVGVGGRQLHPSLLGIDVHRGRPEGAGGEPWGKASARVGVIYTLQRVAAAAANVA